MKQSARRDATVSVRLTTKEMDCFLKMSEKQGLTLSTLVRSILLQSLEVKTRKKPKRSRKQKTKPLPKQQQ